MSSHRSVDRVVAVLDAVARAEAAVGVTQIALAVGAPVSSVHDVVTGLVEHGWLVADGRRYRVGAAPFVLDLLTHGPGHWDTVDVDAHAERSGLGTASAVRVGHHVVYTARSRRLVAGAFAPLVDRHVPRDPLTTAAGRLLLALAPERARSEVLRAARRVDPSVVSDYERHLPEIRRSRTAWSDGLADQRIAAVAVVADDASSDNALVFFGDRRLDRLRLRAAARTVGALSAPR